MRPKDFQSFIAALALSLSVILLVMVSRADERAKAGATVLEAFMLTPAHWTDRKEPNNERLDRGRLIHAAVTSATRDIEEQAALLSLLQHESLGSRYVMEDRCDEGPRGKDECDGGKARGLWQLHRTSCPDAWAAPPGQDRLLIEAKCALAHYRFSKSKCLGVHAKDYVGGLSGYRGQCKTGDSFLRGKTFETYLHVLTHGWPSPPKGWQRATEPDRADRKKALDIMASRTLKPGDWVEVRPGVAALAEFHWHDFGGEARPRGWHLGLSLYMRGGAK